MLLMAERLDRSHSWKDWQGRKALVIGAARQGQAVTRYLIDHGAQVILNDHRQPEDLLDVQAALADLTNREARPLTWILGAHPISLAEDVDLVIVSGGVPAGSGCLGLPLIDQARRLGKWITNDSQIFLAAAACPVVGITGSAGKTTTTSLVGLIARASMALALEIGNQPHGSLPFRQVWIGGNIGSPLITHLDELSADDLAIMELSSFQLDLMEVSPQVAVILNITPNHLDRHGTMEAYTAAKRRIIEFQHPEHTAVLGRDDPRAWALQGHARGRLISFGLSPLGIGVDAGDQEGIFVQDGGIYARLLEPVGGQFVDEFLLPTSSIRLRGEHNLQNVLAACAVSMALRLPVEAIKKGVEGFTGVAHRLEFVRTWGGADWYNDSIATAPERTIAAIRSFEEPLVLLAGGRDKNLPWETFAEEVYRRVDHLIVFGEAAQKILAAMSVAGNRHTSGRPETLTIASCTGLHDAVIEATRIVSPGDVVLLSPGGTSFDEFRDFEERGKCFVQWVTELL